MHMVLTAVPAHPTKLVDDLSFDLVFRKFYAVLVFFARKLIRDKPVAEDIVTEVFCKLWQRQLQFASMQSVKAFLYISTRNACINHLHKQAHQARVRNKIRIARNGEAEDFVLNHIVRAEVGRQLLEQLEQLPGQCRKIMRMSFVLGYTNRRIAHELQLSINTVRNQRARGIHLIRKRQRQVQSS